MVFTIDGANFLDKDDPQWEVVLAVKQQAGGQQSLVGIMTLYNFYAWVPGQVGSHRPRVAQILVVPPYQGQGIGHRLLTAAYDLARQRNTRPLTVSGTCDPTWCHRMPAAIYGTCPERPAGCLMFTVQQHSGVA
jgi:histone acetyltransferase 1